MYQRMPQIGSADKSGLVWLPNLPKLFHYTCTGISASFHSFPGYVFCDMLCVEKWLEAQLKWKVIDTVITTWKLLGEMCLFLPGWNVVSMPSFPNIEYNLRRMKSWIPRGSWWHFLVDKPCSSWQPREIKEDGLLLDWQLWQNRFPWTDVYPYPKVISDIIVTLPTSKVWLLLTE